MTQLLYKNEIIDIIPDDKGNIINKATGEIIPESATKGFNHILRSGLKYNAKLFAKLTDTPYHFWYKLSDEEKREALGILNKAKIELDTFRESKLKKLYKKRTQRALNSKRKKGLVKGDVEEL